MGVEKSILREKDKYKFCQQAIEIKNNLEWKYLELGAMLYKIREERLYEAGWSSWGEYTMELKISAASISRLVRVYEVFVLRFGVAPAQLTLAGGWTNLSELLPLITPDTTGERINELLAIATDNPRENMRRTIKELRNDEICPHLNTHKLVLVVCDDCNDRWQIS